MKKLIAIAVAGLMIPALALAQEGKKWRIHLSVFAASVSRTEFANSFATDGNQLYPYESEDGSQGFVRNGSKAGLGFSLGFSYDVTSLVQSGPGDIDIRAYVEFTLAPSFSYADAPEWEHYFAWDDSTASFVESVYERVQTGRKASFYGLTLGVMMLPFKRIPISFEFNGGLWNWRLESVSPTALAYGPSLDTSAVEDYVESAYKGNGKWEKDFWGFIFGSGLRFYFLKHFSLDLLAKFPLIISRHAWTGFTNIMGDPIKSKVYGTGTIWGVGLSVYY